MRLFSIFLALAATPALAETTLSVTSTAEAAADAQALSGALLAALAPGGERADCPLDLVESGGVTAMVSFMPGPPAGWELVLGPADAPLYATTGEAGTASTAAAAVLEALCPRQGDAATVGPWTASGGGSKITITGTVADLLAPFTLDGVFPGGRALFEYTPVNIGGGAVDYTISGSGVTGGGDGLYSLQALPDGGYVLEQTTEGCVDGIPGSCRQNTDTITLTPAGQ